MPGLRLEISNKIASLKDLTIRIKHSFSRSVAILLYHRVCDVELDPQLLCVSRRNFASQMEFLKDHYQVISLEELSKSLQNGILPKRAVVITFDDGYKDNLVHAKPVLEKHNLPATVFITTGYIGKAKEFWWDSLERIILLAETLPSSLNIKIKDKSYNWEIDSLPAREKELKSYKDWNIMKKISSFTRQVAYKELCGIFLKLSSDEKADLLGYLYQWSGNTEVHRLDYLPLNEDELKILSEGDLISIGSHGCTHFSLSSLSYDLQKYEVEKSKKKLEEIIKRPVNSFSYPFGSKADINEEAVSCVEKAGYEVACTTFNANVYMDSNRLLLGRHIIRDWGMNEFPYRLKRLFNG